jgi:hypothetical protein
MNPVPGGLGIAFNCLTSLPASFILQSRNNFHELAVLEPLPSWGGEHPTLAASPHVHAPCFYYRCPLVRSPVPMKTILCKRLFALASVAALLLAPAMPSNAQTAGLGNINGTVTDTSGAVVAGATVVVTDTDTGISRTVTTTGAGTYTADFLQPARSTARTSPLPSARPSPSMRPCPRARPQPNSPSPVSRRSSTPRRPRCRRPSTPS